jgi:cysteine desulfurase
MKRTVYLDYQATTPVDPEVLESMLPFLRHEFGNPSSRFHALGWKARDAVENARAKAAACLRARPDDIVFTSGCTESNNTALRGIADAYRSRGDHIVTCATEHKSVLDVCEDLQRDGFRVTRLPVGGDGTLDLMRLREAISESTILISLMAVNNEIGVVHPIREIGAIARERNVVFHTDAAQAFATMRLDVDELNVDLLSLSGHKIYGPKGVGLLFVRGRNPAIQLKPLISGGGQERNLRSGTHNVPGIVGLAKAMELCEYRREVDTMNLRSLQTALLEGLRESVSDISLNGPETHRAPNNLNISFRGVEAQALLMTADDIGLSLGSACSGQTIEPSHVLRALHIPDDDMYAAVRFGLGRITTTDEVAYAVHRIASAVASLRERSAASLRR